jgi:bifunctional non-homologous end joining protein LigD
MRLFKYKSKRKLKTSKEPSPKLHKRKKHQPLIFVIQEHHATRLHYDLRLEVNGVLKSWAIPKQPSLDPNVKRLAIQVEDHPYSYKDFEGIIPSGYGAGTVSIWDKGTYTIKETDINESEKMAEQGIEKGSLHFILHGKRLKGEFYLVRLKSSEKNEWLFIKKKDAFSQKEAAISTEKGKGSSKTVKNAELTNLEKLYWPKEKISKKDLLKYYASISSYLLPYLKDRPESLKRFPDGMMGKSFFQKNLKDHPDWVQTVKIQHEEKSIEYLLIQDRETLLFAANLGCIEIHPFFSRTSKLQYPDYLVFDLDPKGASFDHVIAIAQELHEVLEKIGIPHVCKTSGATGLHVAVPLGAKYTYEQAKAFAEIVARIVHKRLPKISTLERSISKRQNKVYIDYLQNNFGQTITAPYSVRARPGAPVSTPLKWAEVKKGLDPLDYHMNNILKRIKKVGDLYRPVLGKGIDLKTALKKIEAIQNK